MWSRGRGWALQSGLRMAAFSADNPVLVDIGQYTLGEILADFQNTPSSADPLLYKFADGHWVAP